MFFFSKMKFNISCRQITELLFFSFVGHPISKFELLLNKTYSYFVRWFFFIHRVSIFSHILYYFHISIHLFVKYVFLKTSKLTFSATEFEILFYCLLSFFSYFEKSECFTFNFVILISFQYVRYLLHVAFSHIHFIFVKFKVFRNKSYILFSLCYPNHSSK